MKWYDYFVLTLLIIFVFGWCTRVDTYVEHLEARVEIAERKVRDLDTRYNAMLKRLELQERVNMQNILLIGEGGWQ